METIMISLDIGSECTPLTLKWVPPGQFTMSNSFIVQSVIEAEYNIDQKKKIDATGEFHVTLTHGYWLGVYPVTRCQWQSVMGTCPDDGTSRPISVNMPVTYITWYDVIEFCDRLNSRSIPKPDGYQFSLPTDAQWEYACKAGTEYKYQVGDELSDLKQVAWYRDITDNLQDVGLKRPNHWGFYDMLGNVNEMCFDGTTYYPDGTKHIDYIGSGQGQYPYRMTRGGCILLQPAEALTYSVRGDIETTEQYSVTGFRLCLRHSV